MALTATATPEVVDCLQQLQKNSVCEMASVNKPNIIYSVTAIKPEGN